jgi:hypothetical protein
MRIEQEHRAAPLLVAELKDDVTQGQIDREKAITVMIIKKSIKECPREFSRLHSQP